MGFYGVYDHIMKRQLKNVCLWYGHCTTGVIEERAK